MRLDKRIILAINYNVKEIIMNKQDYDSLEKETKLILKRNKIKITLDSEQKDFMCKFN